MSRRYTDEQKAWIAESYPSMTNSELARSFSERFGVHGKLAAKEDGNEQD